MVKTSWQNSFKKVSNAFMQMDRFGEQVSFTVKGYDSYPGFFSMLVSLVIFATVLFYGNAKYAKMMDYGDTSFQSFEEPTKNWWTSLHQNQTNLNFQLQFIKSQGGVNFRYMRDLEKYITIEAHLKNMYDFGAGEQLTLR